MAYLWLALIVLAIAGMGAFVVRRLYRLADLGKGLDPLETVLITPMVGLMLAAALAFSLAAFGLYRLAPAVVLLTGSILALLTARRLPLRGLGGRLLLAVAALAALIVLYWPVADMARGGLDAGVYVNAAAILGRSGGIVVRDAGLLSLPSDLHNEFFLKLHPDRYLLHHMRFAGFYVLDGARGLVLPQLFHFYPALLGLAVSVSGTPVGLKLNALIGALAVAAYFLAARRVFDAATALLAASMLAISAVEIWFSRYTTTEITGQLLFFVALWAVASAHQTQPPRAQAALGVVGGAAMGEMLLLHPDFPFLLPVLICYGVGLRLTRSWRAWHWWFFGTTGLFAVALAGYIGVFAYPYVGDLYYHIIKAGRANWALVSALGLTGILAVLVADRAMPSLLGLAARQQQAVRYLFLGTGCLLAGLGLYAYMLRPGILEDALRGEWQVLWGYVGAPVDAGPATTFVRFGWYLSPLGVLTALAAFPVMVAQRPRWDRWFWLGFFVLYSLIFLEETYAKSHYIYTMRRYVPIVFPSFIVLIAFGITGLWRSRLSALAQRLAKAFSVALAVLMLTFFAFTDRAILAHWEWGGFSEKLQELATYFPPNAVILLSDGRDPPQTVATPLWSLYGLETYVLVRDEPDLGLIATQVDRWTREGRPVYALLGTNGGKLSLPNYSLQPLGEWHLDVKEFEQLFDQKPLNVYTVPFDMGIYKVAPESQRSQLAEVIMGRMEYDRLVSGFYDREEQNGQVFRWTAGKALLRLDPGFQPKRLKLLLSAGPPERPGKVEVLVALNGKQVSTLDVSKGGFRWYSVEVPTELQAGGGGPSQGSAQYILSLSSPTFTMSSLGLSHDGRRLGIQIAGVVVEP